MGGCNHEWEEEQVGGQTIWVCIFCEEFWGSRTTEESNGQTR